MMKKASIIQMPYFFRKRGTGRLLPTNFWTRSLIVANGQIAHQKRPRNKKMIGMSGHHSTQVRAVPRLSCADSGPSSNWNMMTMKTNSVGHWITPGNHLLRKNRSMTWICKILPPAKRLLFRDLSSVVMLLSSLHRNGLFFQDARGSDQDNIDCHKTPQHNCLGEYFENVNNKISL